MLLQGTSQAESPPVIAPPGYCAPCFINTLQKDSDFRIYLYICRRESAKGRKPKLPVTAPL